MKEFLRFYYTNIFNIRIELGIVAYSFMLLVKIVLFDLKQRKDYFPIL